MVATLALHMLIAFQELGWVSRCCGRVYSGGNVQIFSIDALHSLYFVFWFTRSSACLILQTFK